VPGLSSISSIARGGRRSLFRLLTALLLTSSAAASSQQVGQNIPDSALSLPTGFRSETAVVGGESIHYVIGGKGSPVLLVHGWPETWREWRKVMPLLANRHTVIAVDLPGFGESRIAASGYDKKTLAEEMFRLMQKLGYAHIILVGHDWGGPVAYAYAATHGDNVDKLIVIEGAAQGPWTLQATAPLLHNPLWFFGFFEIPGYPEKVVAGHEKDFLDWFYTNNLFHVVPGAFSNEDIAYYENSFSRPGRFAASLQLYRTLDQDIADNTQFSKTPLSVPVPAVGAQRGLGAGVAQVMQIVATHVTPVLMNDTGHFIPEERPQVLADLIQDFLEGKPVPPAWTPPAIPAR
jgi:pimeloyl-ACP methyl ester carboxylesterase